MALTELGNGRRLGEFRIIRPLGRGGMGSVYLAEDLRLGRKVALKLILPELSRDQEFRRRFEAEARNAAAIEHPNVVPILSAGAAEGHLYLAMRYIDGTDLGADLDPRASLAIERAIAIVGEVGAALDAAHAVGLVHRDVKPANILLAREGSTYLTDFGIARRLDGSRGLTETGQVLAALDYAAPEQVKAGRVDARTDVYGLGCVLYRALSGRVPHPVTDAQKIWSIVEDPIAPIERLDPALNEVIRRATAKDPAERYASTGDLARAAASAAGIAAGEGPEGSVATGEAATGVLEAAPTEALTRPLRDQVFLEAATSPLADLPNRKPRRWRWIGTPLLGALALLAVGATAALLIGGGGESAPPSPAQTTAAPDAQADAPARSAAAESSATESAAPLPALAPFEANAYSGEAPLQWIHDPVDERGSNAMYTNVWSEPGGGASYVRIDGGNLITSAEVPPGMTAARYASAPVIEALEADPGYREVSIEEVTIGSVDSIRWVFEIEGDKRVDYFFVECERGLAVLGSTTPARFAELAPMFHRVAATTILRCPGD